MLLSGLLLSCKAHAILSHFGDDIRHVVVLYSIGIVVCALIINTMLSMLEQARVVGLVLPRLLSLVDKAQIAVVHVRYAGCTAYIFLALACH